MRRLAKKPKGRTLLAIMAALLAWFSVTVVWPKVDPLLVKWSPKVKAVDIDMAENNDLSKSEVLALAKIPLGKPLIKISPRKAMQAIAGHPLVAKVRLRRHFNGRISISLETRKPVAIVAISQAQSKADQLFYCDATGTIYKRLNDEDSFDFPIITGMTSEDMQTQQTVIKSGIELIEATRPFTDRFDQVLSEVHIDPKQGFTIYTDSIGGGVVIGMPPFGEKLQRLERMIPQLEGRLLEIERIDLDYQKKAFVRFKQPGEQILAER